MLEKMKKGMENHELSKLWKSNFVPGEGPKNADIMFCGEAPGFNEEKEKRPFIGRAGKLLRSLMEKHGIDPAKVYITNVVKFRPPENRKPTPDEIKMCIEYLNNEIRSVRPKIVVLLGDTALKALLGKSYAVTRDHGKIVDKNGVKFLIAPHPSAALRYPMYKEILEEDLETLRKIKVGKDLSDFSGP